jgi:predicted phosphodiesterase
MKQTIVHKNLMEKGTMRRGILFCIVILGAAFGAYPEPDGLWLFDDPEHLTRSVIGSDLEETGSHQTVSGMSAGDGAVEDGVGSYFTCIHGLSANGGGIYVNQWTLMLDIKVPTGSVGKWISLFQTNTSNSNDADCFVHQNRTIGISATGYTSTTIPSETWKRVVISVSNGSFYRIYVDGVKWLEGTVQAVDGRYGLESTLLLFADENGEDNPIHCTTAAIWGQALTDTQISSLGSASNPITIEILRYVGVNLLSNPSGEKDMADWTAAEGVDWQATDRTDWHWPKRGSYYFTPGRTAFGELAQTIRLDYLGSEIDNGRVVGKAEGFIGGGDDAQGRLLVDYLDIDNHLLTSDDSGWIAGPASSDWLSQVLPDADGFVLPAGTRAVRFRFMAQRLTGTDCDAFGDDFAWEFKLAGNGNGDPGIPSVMSSSVNGTVTDDIAFMIASIDPDGDSVAYQIDWGNESSEWSDVRASGANYILSHRWPAAGTYPVRVRSRDTSGGLSAWSAALVITITGQDAGVFKSQPYLQNVSPGAITIAWETDRIVSARVDWGLTSSYGNQASGLCINAGSGVYICKVRITGLEAQTPYHFRARNGSTLGGDAVFTTAPHEQTPFTFAVWGDSQRETVNAAVSQAMFTDMAAGVDFGVGVGDVVENSSYTYFSNPFRKYLLNIFARQKPVFIAFGNHDEPETSLVHKAIQNSGMHTFSFNYGNSHFTCIDYSQLNDHTLPYDDSISSLPLGWLEQDLASDEAQNAAWRLMFVHVPPYCERWLDGSSILRTYLVPLMRQYGVQMCFSGHTHEYERGVLDGTWYVITGCGSYLDTGEAVVKDWPHMTVGGAHNIDSFIGGCVNGYSIIDIQGTELTLKQHAYTSNGTYYGVIDTVHVLQADFTQDGSVDLDDFAVLARAWQATPEDADWRPVCDLAERENRVIDISDLAVFVQYWQCP